MSKKITKAGGKYTKSHSSAIPASKKYLDFLDNLNDVKKISLGIIKASCPSKGQGYLKTKQRPSGFLLTVRGNNSIQEIGIYTDQASDVIKKLNEKFIK